MPAVMASGERLLPAKRALVASEGGEHGLRLGMPAGQFDDRTAMYPERQTTRRRNVRPIIWF